MYISFHVSLLSLSPTKLCTIMGKDYEYYSIYYFVLFIGSLTHAYDELGNHYSIPPYCLSRPTNFVSDSTATDSTTTDVRMNQILSKGGNPINVKIRLSNQSKDIKLTISSTDTVINVKKRLEEEYNVKSDKITMLFSGKILTDSTILGQLDIPKGFIIQAIVR